MQSDPEIQYHSQISKGSSFVKQNSKNQQEKLNLPQIIVTTSVSKSSSSNSTIQYMHNITNPQTPASPSCIKVAGFTPSSPKDSDTFENISLDPPTGSDLKDVPLINKDFDSSFQNTDQKYTTSSLNALNSFFTKNTSNTNSPRTEETPTSERDELSVRAALDEKFKNLEEKSRSSSTSSNSTSTSSTSITSPTSIIRNVLQGSTSSQTTEGKQSLVNKDLAQFSPDYGSTISHGSLTSHHNSQLHQQSIKERSSSGSSKSQLQHTYNDSSLSGNRVGASFISDKFQMDTDDFSNSNDMAADNFLSSPNQPIYNSQLNSSIRSNSIEMDSPRNLTSLSVNIVETKAFSDLNTDSTVQPTENESADMLLYNQDNSNELQGLHARNKIDAMSIGELEEQPTRGKQKTIKKKSNRPSNFFLFQQEMPEISSSMFYEWYCMSINFAIIFLISLIIGIAISIGNASVQDKYLTVNYSNPTCKEILWDTSKTLTDQIDDLKVPSDFSDFQCAIDLHFSEKWEPPIYLHYELTNFFQAHRMYGNSISSSQLGGSRISASQALSAGCLRYYSYLSQEELDNLNDEERGNVALSIHPCGLSPYAKFNDTFVLVNEDEEEVCNTASQNSATCSSDGAIFSSESKKVQTTDPYTNDQIDFILAKGTMDTTPEYYPNEPSHLIPQVDNDLREWLRVSPFEKATKAFRVINVPLEGNYRLYIHSVYPAEVYGGSKIVTFRKLTWVGGPNWTLAIFYFILAGCCILVSTSCLIIGGIKILRRYIKKLQMSKMKEVSID